MMDLLDPSTLPPGFGFHPTDVELISHYLKRKVMGVKNDMEVIPVVDIYKYEPWDLPAKSRIPSREGKWHFFNTRDRKYPNGFRSNRATEAGYWKSTGKDRVIRVQKRAIGTKKTLVFHQGRPPRGRRTEWIMHEYYLDDNEYKNAANAKNIYVLCRVTKRTGLTPESDNAPDHAEKEDSPLSLDELSAESLEDTCLLDENIVEPRTLTSAEFDAWVSELYDPAFSGVSAPTNQGKQEVGSGLLAPKTEPVVLPLAADDVPGDQLLTGMMDFNSFDFSLDFFAPALGFEEMNPLFLDQDTILDYNAQEYFDPANFLEACQQGPGEAKAEIIGGFPSDGCGPLPAISETGIQIRERRPETFVEPSGHRIRLQIHKMEAPNNRASDETHVFVSHDHHLDGVGPAKDTTVAASAADSKNNDTQYGGRPATPERNEHKPYQRPSQHNPQNNYEPSYTSGYGYQYGYPPYYHYEYKQGSDTKANKPRFSRDSRFRDDVRRLVRGARKEARSIVHRYTSMARNCLFIGTCLMGGTALATFMQEVF